MTESRNIYDSDLDITVDGSTVKGKVTFDFGDILTAVPKCIRDKAEPSIVSHGRVNHSIELWEKTKGEEFVLIGGKLAYEIACESNIPFNVRILHFTDRIDAERYILERRLLHEYYSPFQRGVTVLKFKELCLSQGKENMRKGGKGFKISEKVNTWKFLGKLAGYSHTTLKEVDFIIKNLQDAEIWQQLVNDKIKIHRVFTNLGGNTTGITDKLPSLTNPIPKYFIDQKNKYQIVYIHPKWNLTDQICFHNRFIEDLMNMNIEEITYDKFSTLFFQIPSKFISEAFEMINRWGFKVTNSITVKHESILYTSEFAEHTDEYLWICKKNNNGAPLLPSISKIQGAIPKNRVLSFIENLYPDKYCKLNVFTEARSGWDSYDFDLTANKMKLQINATKTDGQLGLVGVSASQRKVKHTLHNPNIKNQISKIASPLKHQQNSGK